MQTKSWSFVIIVTEIDIKGVSVQLDRYLRYLKARCANTGLIKLNLIKCYLAKCYI